MNKLLKACAGLLLILGLPACAQKKYNVDYCGKKECFTNAKDSYRAGEKVRLYYDMIGTDTDYSFWLDNQKLNCLYNQKKGYEIRFTMPEHDVKLECRTSSSMYVQDGNDMYDEDMDVSQFAAKPDDSIAFKLPDYGSEFSGGMILIEVTLMTVSFPDQVILGTDSREIIISEGDVIPLGGPNNLVLTVTEDHFSWFTCQSNIPLSIGHYSTAEEKTEFDIRGSDGTWLFDVHSGEYTCVYIIRLLTEG